MRKLGRAFFRRDAEWLARDLIGTVLVHRWKGREVSIQAPLDEGMSELLHELAWDDAVPGREQRS